MTLVELLVSMSVLSIALAAVFGVLFSVQRGVERQMDIAERQERARAATEAIDREVRSAIAMTTSPDGQTVAIYGANNLDARGGDRTTDNLICAQFTIDGGVLKRRFWVDPKTPADTPVPWNIVVPGITSTADAFVVPLDADVVPGSNDLDPDNLYRGSILEVTLSLGGEGDAVEQDVSQVLRGDNVSVDNDNPCDDPAAEQPPDA